MSERPTDDYRQRLAAAGSFIRERDDFLVVSHVQPDGDAISSTLAVGWMLRSLNKRFLMINECDIPAKFDYLWGTRDIATFAVQSPDRSFDCVISVDCADFSRIGDVSRLFGASAALLNVDHHSTNDGFGSVQLIRTGAAATAEILYDLAQEIGVVWTKELADCIYTGLLTDTGGFRYANTTPNVMRIASEMLAYGVNGNDLADRLLEKLSFPHVQLLKQALARLSFSADRRIAWTSVSLDDIGDAGASNEDLEGIVNYPRNIEGVEVGLLFKETAERKHKVSLRSAGRVDVARIAQTIGGGGHARAAGCTVEGTLDEAVARVVGKVEAALR